MNGNRKIYTPLLSQNIIFIYLFRINHSIESFIYYKYTIRYNLFVKLTRTHRRLAYVFLIENEAIDIWRERDRYLMKELANINTLLQNNVFISG